MHRFGPEVLRTIESARKNNAKVSVFDDAGCLLWYCETWSAQVGTMQHWAEALGHGWLEFIHADDMEACKRWIAAGDGALLVARSIHPQDPNSWQRFCLVKKRIGLYWVCLGERADLISGGPSCETIDGLLSIIALLPALCDQLFCAVAPQPEFSI